MKSKKKKKHIKSSEKRDKQYALNFLKWDYIRRHGFLPANEVKLTPFKWNPSYF